MPVVSELARAKVNLSLGVLGRRRDGYHEIVSLVAFADAADTLLLDTAGADCVTVEGPFAAAIDGRNLVEAALELLCRAEPRLGLGAVRLVKSLPVSAGLGGGSADAAALLRAVKRANPGSCAQVDWHAIAVRLGADVAVCLGNRAAWITGRGERVDALRDRLPALDVVLVNSLRPVPRDKTAQVFRRLNANSLAEIRRRPLRHGGVLDSRENLVAYMRDHDNDLEEPARATMPEIADVMAALRDVPQVLVARLSGAGPTCFGVFLSREDAACAAAALTRKFPNWWIAATRLS